MANFIDRVIGFFRGGENQANKANNIDSQKVETENKQLDLNRTAGRMYFPSPFTFGFDFGGTAPESGIMALLDECRSVLGKSKDPYKWIKFSDEVFSYLPFYQLAITKRAEYIGNVVLKDTQNISDRTKAAVLEFMKTVPTLFEQPKPHAICVGIDAIARDIVIGSQRVGCGIIEERYDENGNFVGVMKYNPRNFMYQLNGDNQELTYYGFAANSESLKVIALEYEDGFLWGKPLIYGGAWSVENFTSIVEAYKNGSMRVANPSTLTTIGVNDVSMFETQIVDGKETMTGAGEIYMDTIQKMNSLSAQNLARMNRGQSAHSVVSIPGDININTHSFGEGVNGTLDKDSITIYAIMLAANIGVPASMLELFLSGNSAMNRNEKEKILEYLNTWINGTRTTIKPYLLALIKNHLRRLNFPINEIENVDIDFEFSFAVSEKEKLENRFKQAEIDEKVIKVWETLAMLNTDVSTQYLIDNGFQVE